MITLKRKFASCCLLAFIRWVISANLAVSHLPETVPLAQLDSLNPCPSPRTVGPYNRYLIKIRGNLQGQSPSNLGPNSPFHFKSPKTIPIPFAITLCPHETRHRSQRSQRCFHFARNSSSFWIFCSRDLSVPTQLSRFSS